MCQCSQRRERIRVSVNMDRDVPLWFYNYVLEVLMQLWWGLIIPLQDSNAPLDLLALCRVMILGMDADRWEELPVLLSLRWALFLCESCCLRDTEHLIKEHKAASFKLPLVLILKKKFFVHFASLLMARSCFSKKEKEKKKKSQLTNQSGQRMVLGIRGERSGILNLCLDSRQSPL